MTVEDVLLDSQVGKEEALLKNVTESPLFRWEPESLLRGVERFPEKRDNTLVRVQDAAYAVEQGALTAARHTQHRRHLMRDEGINLKTEVPEPLMKAKP